MHAKDESPTPETIQAYVKCRNKLNLLVSNRRKELFHNRMSKLDPRNPLSWKILRARGTDNEQQAQSPPLEVSNTLITSDKAKANAFARHFARHNATAPRAKVPPPRRTTTIHDIPVQEEEVRSALEALQNNKAAGKDDI